MEDLNPEILQLQQELLEARQQFQDQVTIELRETIPMLEEKIRLAKESKKHE